MCSGSEATSKVVSLQTSLAGRLYPQNATPLYLYITSAVALAQKPKSDFGPVNIDMKFHVLRHRVESIVRNVIKIDGNEIPTDTCTKASTRERKTVSS